MGTRTWIWTQALLMGTKVEAEASPGTHLLSGFLFFSQQLFLAACVRVLSTCLSSEDGGLSRQLSVSS